jgi:basic membrane protein A
VTAVRQYSRSAQDSRDETAARTIARRRTPHRRAALNRHVTRIVPLLLIPAIVAGCGIFSGPTPAPSATATPTAAPTPTPEPKIKSITLVAVVDEPSAATETGLTWTGLQDAGKSLGIPVAVVRPASNAQLFDRVDAAATPGGVVVTVGPDAVSAVAAAATAHPDVEFVEIGVVPATGSPANVHGLVFDEAQAGYVAGYIAESFAGGGTIGFVGDTESDVTTLNYRNGYAAGAGQANAEAKLTYAYAGSPDLPEKGRTAGAAVLKAGAKVVAAMPDLSGIGAMRQVCTGGARLVGLAFNLSALVPDVGSCVVGSVWFRYDLAATDAMLTLAAGKELPALTVANVRSGGIDVTEFQGDLPDGFTESLAGVMAALAAES